VPVLNEEALLPELRRRLQGALEPVAGGHEIVFVDDGSTDGSAPMIEHWTQEDDSIMLVQLSRNFGMDVAMSAGLDYASGDWVCLLHADLQDPPELIPEMLAMAEAGADVVYARRIGREDSRMKRWLAIAFYAVMERLAQVPYQGQAGDFRLMSRRVVEVVRQMPERRRFLRGMVAWSGFTQVPIEYRRAGRLAGRGATYPELFRLAIEAVTSFSDVPLSLATYAGITTSATSAAAAVALLLLTIAGVVSASGTVWLAAVVLFLAGMQLITVGIIGRYLARVHHEILHRPLYIVARTVRRGSQRTDG
jgi:glycosyltransferase involved in cell wall biosynthesis